MFCKAFTSTRFVHASDKGNSTHRKLDEKTGIFTFIGIGRKEDPTKKDLSIQAYVSPELYETPRF